MCAAQQLKRYYDPEDLCGEEWELNDEEIAALDLQGAVSPMEVEGELSNTNGEEMAKEVFYLVKSVIGHRYRRGCFLTLWRKVYSVFSTVFLLLLLLVVAVGCPAAGFG